MARILSIDFGLKRMGLAVTDPSQIIATGLCTIDSFKIFEFLDKYLKDEEVERFVIGEPLQLDGSKNSIYDNVVAFSKKLTEKYPNIPISWEDERYTSKMAKQTLIDSGLKKKARRNKALLDEVSATIILQSYLQSHST